MGTGQEPQPLQSWYRPKEHRYPSRRSYRALNPLPFDCKKQFGQPRSSHLN
eukprot:c10970_g1_i1 orf=293-445(+)